MYTVKSQSVSGLSKRARAYWITFHTETPPYVECGTGQNPLEDSWMIGKPMYSLYARKYKPIFHNNMGTAFRSSVTI